MIVEALASLVTTLFGLVMDGIALLDIPPSSTVTDPILSGLLMIRENILQLGAWVPFDTAGVALNALFFFILATFAVRLARMVLSLMTAGGGMGG